MKLIEIHGFGTVDSPVLATGVSYPVMFDMRGEAEGDYIMDLVYHFSGQTIRLDNVFTAHDPPGVNIPALRLAVRKPVGFVFSRVTLCRRQIRAMRLRLTCSATGEVVAQSVPFEVTDLRRARRIEDARSPCLPESSVRSLMGIGPYIQAQLAIAGVHTVADLHEALVSKREDVVSIVDRLPYTQNTMQNARAIVGLSRQWRNRAAESPFVEMRIWWDTEARPGPSFFSPPVEDDRGVFFTTVTEDHYAPMPAEDGVPMPAEDGVPMPAEDGVPTIMEGDDDAVTIPAVTEADDDDDDSSVRACAGKRRYIGDSSDDDERPRSQRSSTASSDRLDGAVRRVSAALSQLAGGRDSAAYRDVAKVVCELLVQRKPERRAARSARVLRARARRGKQ